MKIFAFLFGVAVLFFVLGITGWLFPLWPTSLFDHPIELTPAKVSQLQVLLQERKFVADLTIPYPGAMNELDRAQSQAVVDALLHELLLELPKSPRRSVVLGSFKKTLTKFTTLESEERDRICGYLDQVAKILELRSTGELLNVWRYGLPLGWLPIKTTRR